MWDSFCSLHLLLATFMHVCVFSAFRQTKAQSLTTWILNLRFICIEWDWCFDSSYFYRRMIKKEKINGQCSSTWYVRVVLTEYQPVQWNKRNKRNSPKMDGRGVGKLYGFIAYALLYCENFGKENRTIQFKFVRNSV